jgi:VIT1/CCC1 family predicted Fe2+/Mn2+ transporter
MYPWTSGVAGLVLFLTGALATRKTPIARSITRLGILLLGIIVLGVVLGLRQAPCR